jgi:SAM-dependent methyltransferase
MADDTGNPLVARLYDPVMAIPERTMLPRHRESLADGLSGEVLDLGAGTGAMFPYFDKLDGPIHVTAVEPDPGMRRQARKRAASLDVDIHVVDVDAEALPYDDGSFDAVVGSFVFCTIPDHEAAFSEVARVLVDGGEFRFLEHVRGDGLPGTAHDLLAPCWHAAAGGCTLNRETDRLFLSDDRFRTDEFERNDGFAGTVLPVVRGTLVRRPRPLLDRIGPSIRP